MLDFFFQSKFLIIIILIIISIIINIIQFFISLNRDKGLYSRISFRNMMYTTIALLFAIPIGEGVLKNFGITLSETGLISTNIKDIYMYAMAIFCFPYIIITLGSQIKWFAILYLATVFKGISTPESLALFKEIIEIIVSEKIKEKE